MPPADPVISLRGVSKDYQALRPLRIAALDLHAGQSVAVLGLDSVAAEVLINLITGSSLPDSGDVTVLGEPTSAITDAHAWMRTLERFGLLSDRSVLVEQLTAEQNLVMPYSLDFENTDAALYERVRALAEEVGVPAADLNRQAGQLPPAVQLRVRLGRALALDPRILLAAHPNAVVPPEDVSVFAADLAVIIARRTLTTLTLTADPQFAKAVAHQILTLEPATGVLKSSSVWRRWFL